MKAVDQTTKKILDRLHQYVWLVEADGKITFANARVRSWTGRETAAGELLWKSAGLAIPEQDAATLRAMVASAAAGTSDRLDTEAIRQDGAVLPLDLRVSPFVDDPAADARVLVTAVDVSDVLDRQAERGRMAAIVEHSPDFIGTATPGGRILSINRAGRTLVGLGPDADPAGMPVTDLHPEEVREKLESIAIPYAVRHGAWRGQTLIRGAQGALIPVSQVIVSHRDAAGELRYLSTVLRDVTDEYRTRARLFAEVRVATITETASSLGAVMEEVFSALIEDLGAEAVDWWEPGPGDLVHAAGRTQGATSQRSPERGRYLQAVAAVADLHDSAIHWSKRRTLGAPTLPLPEGVATLLGCPVRVEGNLEGVLTAHWSRVEESPELATTGDQIARSISAFVRRLRAEEARALAQAEAEAASQSKSEFLANMSHEIRTPMTAILGYSEMLSTSLSDPDDLQVLATIRRNGQHLLDLVSDILDLSKVEAGKLELQRSLMAPAEVALEVVHLMELRANEENLELVLDLDELLPDQVFTDRVRLRQILVNLVGNAVKFTTHGTVILRVRHAGDSVVYEVEDTGIGIDPDRLDALFEPFVQSDTSSAREYQGTGLGLAISRRLSHALGGTLEATSQLGVGSTFSLTVPVGHSGYRLQKPMLEPLTTPIDVPAARALSGSMLVVDDRDDIRVWLRYVLERAGAQVETARNGREAVERILSPTDGRAFDGVLMDMQMPEMDGLTATRVLREGAYPGAILALTAGALAEDRATALAAGCDAFLTKPIEPRELVAEVARVLERKSAVTGGPDASEDGLPAGAPDGTTLDRVHVLLVEDDPDVGEMMAMLLEAWGCAVDLARNAAEAEGLAESATAVHVILSDLRLPDVSGLDLLPRLLARPSCNGALCVALSGMAGHDTIQSAHAAGFHHHLQKPAETQRLRDIIDGVREGVVANGAATDSGRLNS